MDNQLNQNLLASRLASKKVYAVKVSLQRGPDKEDQVCVRFDCESADEFMMTSLYLVMAAPNGGEVIKEEGRSIYYNGVDQNDLGRAEEQTNELLEEVKSALARPSENTLSVVPTKNPLNFKGDSEDIATLTAKKDDMKERDSEEQSSETPEHALVTNSSSIKTSQLNQDELRAKIATLLRWGSSEADIITALVAQGEDYDSAKALVGAIQETRSKNTQRNLTPPYKRLVDYKSS